MSKYLDTSAIKENSKFHKTTVPHDMVFTKEDTPTSEKQAEALYREYKIHYRVFVRSTIYILSTRVDLSFAVH